MTTERRDDDEAEWINRQSPMPASAMDSLAGIGFLRAILTGVKRKICRLPRKSAGAKAGSSRFS